MIDKERLAVVEQQLKSIQDASTKRWAIVPALIGAVSGAITGSLLTFLLK